MAEALSIVSVLFGNSSFLERNVALTKALNPGQAHRWIVVDNSAEPATRWPGSPTVRVLPGTPRPRTRDAGSLHHAMALERGLEHVDTRFVLLLDHDFYVIRPDWVTAILAHALDRQLALFGSVWHPRWFYQYRSFPSVHFMLVDTDRIDPCDLELRPDIDGDLWWRLINDDRIPIPRPLRDTLKSQRIRDVGWRIHRRFRNSVPYETLVPHYLRPREGRARWEARLALLLPDRWLKFPAVGARHTERTFLRKRMPDAYRLQWEEFFWRSEPFAVHLRRVGRSRSSSGTAEDGPLLQTLLAGIESRDLAGDGDDPVAVR